MRPSPSLPDHTWVALRAPQPDDAAALDELTGTAPEPGVGGCPLCAPAPGVLRLDPHDDGDVAVRFVVHARTGEEVLGLATVSALDLRNGTAVVAVSVRPEAEGTGCAEDAARLVVAHAFRAWPLRRLYAIVRARGGTGAGPWRAAGFSVEATLRGHEYHDGRGWDVSVLACTREQWSGRAGAVGS